MESVELYHAEHITQPLKLASYEQLRYTHVLIDKNKLPRTSISLFNPTLRLLWIAGRDLMHDEAVWVPHELVHTDYTLPFPAGSGCFPFTSNGLASGNHLLEAISHGICELVERDATSLWHLKSEALQAETRVDLGSVSDEACRSVLNRYADADIEVAVWETTTDIGIASFLCTIFDTMVSAFRPLYPTSGMGCHPARDVALLRALTEAAQSRLTLIAGSRDDAIRTRYEEALDRDAIRAVRGAIARETATRNISDAPNWEAETLDEDVDWELGRLAAVGVERVVVVDLTKPEISLPVVRVVAPELEGSDRVPGYLPGARGKAALNSNQ
jgi:ribosomal protein S12 methylthiotransferase accessory factor